MTPRTKCLALLKFRSQFTHSEIQHSSDGEWYYTDASTYIIGPGGWYATDKISSTEDEIWDQACYY